MVQIKTGEAFAQVAIDRNLVKVYDNAKIYMKGGQEFGFWLVNNTTSTQKAEIELNGKLISSRGLVLRPGQKTWLDCNWETHRKFKFETYEIENTEEAKNATANNGRVKVWFYPEKEYQRPIVINEPQPYIINRPAPIIINPIPWHPWSNPYWYGGSPIYNQCANANYGSKGSTCSSNTTMSCNVGMNQEVNGETQPEQSRNLFSCGVTMDSMETGRVEAGAKSDMQFENVELEFSGTCSYTSEFRILPMSLLPVSPQDLRLKCECGKNLKRKDKFCSRCGKRVK